MDFFSSRSNNDITELSWENGQPLKHEHVPTVQTSKTTWGSTDDTLESIVHLATCQNINISEFDYQPNHHQSSGNKNSTIATTAIGKRGENSRNIEINHPRHANKRAWSSEYSDQCKDMKSMRNVQQAHADRRLCGSASATFCSDNDTTMVTEASFESSRSLKTKSVNGDSTFHPGSENPYAELENKGGTFQHRPSRRSRVAAIHNQSERKRRDRINEKIKTLQKLVPNANKTDKASMLDEVIDHLKQLQEQVRIMSTRNIPQMMMPLEMQQQLHMSHFARMAMGASLGMCMGPMHDIINLAQSASQPLSSLIHKNSATTAITPTFIPPQFSLPAVIPRHIQPQVSAIQGSTNSNHAPYSALLEQSMNMELYNKMAAAIYQQQVKQAGQTTNDTSNLKHVQGE